eukprot:scaffold177_cov334-Pavlova_lutheri.AAC.45
MVYLKYTCSSIVGLENSSDSLVMVCNTPTSLRDSQKTIQISIGSGIVCKQVNLSVDIAHRLGGYSTMAINLRGEP